MDGFRERYAAHETFVRAQRVMSSGATRGTLYAPPAIPYAQVGSGFSVIDQLGHEVIDLSNNYTSMIHGHAHPQIAAVAADVAASGTCFSLPTAWDVRLAETMKGRTGHPFWRFTNSGTEAVMSAVRAARAFTGRNGVIRFEGSYHGTSDVAAPQAAPGITPGVSSEILELPAGDIDAVRAAFTAQGTDIAAVLIDLMPNRSGLVPASRRYVSDLADLAQQHGALLIVDEVITLRLNLAGLAGEYGVKPDLITAGKIIGGGYPVGAVGGREDVLDMFNPARSRRIDWGGTFSANPVTMAAGCTALDLYDADAIERLNQLGNNLRHALVDAGLPVTGAGSLMRIRAGFDSPELWWQLYQAGLLLATNGLVCLSTPMSGEVVERIAETIITTWDSSAP